MDPEKTHEHRRNEDFGHTSSVKELLSITVNEDSSSKSSKSEQEILNSQIQSTKTRASYIGLIVQGGRICALLYFTTFVLSGAVGMTYPANSMIFGDTSNDIFDFLYSNTSLNDFVSAYTYHSLSFLVLACVSLTALFACFLLGLIVGEVITSKIRVKYVTSLFNQNLAYHDENGIASLSSAILHNAALIQSGLSDKFVFLTYNLVIVIGSLVLSLAVAWRFALILFPVYLLMIGLTILLSYFMRKNSLPLRRTELELSAMINEFLTSIPVIHAYGLRRELISRVDEFSRHLHKRRLTDVLLAALNMGLSICISYLIFALGFWLGHKLTAEGRISTDNMLCVLLVMAMGASSVYKITFLTNDISVCTSAAEPLLSLINRQSPVPSLSHHGKQLDSLDGQIEFCDIKFAYPSRPKHTVLPRFSLTIEPGSTVAIVGPSGSGKSTLINLIERFYLPLSGRILLDNHDIADLDVRWLRRHMSLVTQEPVLFSGSIFDNIAKGLDESFKNTISSEELHQLVHTAADACNALGFITSLPDGFDTDIGLHGGQLSGGQRQRICIARAIISKPKILLLDEATSALDASSESVVQAALENVSKFCTTLMITHKLASVKNADRIVVLKAGEIVEDGTHEELLAREGAYFDLVSAQCLDSDSVSIEDMDTMFCKRSSVATTKSSFFEHSALPVSLPDMVEDMLSPGSSHSVWSDIQFSLSVLKGHRWKAYSSLALMVLAGCIVPLSSIIFGYAMDEMRMALFYPDQNTFLNLTCILYLVLGITCLVALMYSVYFMAYCGIELIERARAKMLENLLSLNLKYYDEANNDPNIIAADISQACDNIRTVLSTAVFRLVTSIVTIIMSVVICFAYSWKMALVNFAGIFLVCISSLITLKQFSKVHNSSRSVFSKSTSTVCEALKSLKIVWALDCAVDIVQTYESDLWDSLKKNIWRKAVISLGMSFSLSFRYFLMAAMFYYGCELITDNEVEMNEFYIALLCLTNSAQAIAIAVTALPEMQKYKHAMNTIWKLLEATDDNRLSIDERKNLISMDTVVGRVAFRSVSFRYPSRPDTMALQRLSFSAAPGQFVALVGSSGSGKSTAISLLECFYNVFTGDITVDDQSIRQVSSESLRKHMSLVPQMPVLYSGTIKYNVALGLEDPSSVSLEKVIEVCKLAHIHDVIVNLPDGYDTLVGEDGLFLSGGQRQRISIARALIRDPRILLLDEATSALDAESEKLVQQSLNAARKGRTTICVAHRLSTIKNADIIYVLDHGTVVEFGTHTQLVAKDGIYAKMVRMQEHDL
ncbi:hypothetical protein CANCADRAFT_106442 [Tortispora caseinolytica NRRL Y-17796]|uniref:Uncharacterized protein n=1 Tax=Tortispora caseinolytica NRRL Y-17796 TaxID=767744 RepID=A0A1E4TF82_9ASCO|nr:hypothetical protein CANCADRAFT_106442 [Tortispora caseinolytica NRRL Y-17796]